MTRAEDRLYVAGWRAKKAPAGISWYEMIREGIEPIAHVEADCLIVDCPQTGDPDGRVAAMDRPTPVAALPSWAASPPIADAHPPRPLSPSRLEPEPPVRSPFEDGDSRRFRRGRIIHYLLQWLPTMAPELRDAAARHYLSRPIHDLPLVEQDTYIVEIHKLFYDPRLQDLFSSQALAEVPIVGMVGEGAGAVVLSGRIDRLLVRDDEILVVDFKTNRPPPHRVEDVPGAYLRQMAAYRVLLADIYPGRSVRCALLWTDGPNLMDLPEQLLSVSAGPGRLLLPELDGPPGAS
jgi:ATP-dependent helicase/nuclease subunit A